MQACVVTISPESVLSVKSNYATQAQTHLTGQHWHMKMTNHGQPYPSVGHAA